MPAVDLLAAWAPILIEPGDAVAIPVTVPSGYETGTWTAVVYSDRRQTTTMATFAVAVVGQVVTISLTSAQTAALVPSGSVRFTGYWELVRTAASVPRTMIKGDFVADPTRLQITNGSTALTLTVSSGAVTVTGGALTLTDVTAAIGTTDLADLADVDATSPTSGQALVWDGDSWGPATVAGGGTHGSTHVTGAADPVPVATTSTGGLMSSADKTKLDGIEAGATADQSAAEILAALVTVDGSGSGLDADTLDGSHAAAFQPIDADLTTIAGLSPTNDDVLQRKAGAWTNRTPAQLKTDLAIAAGDVSGLGALATLSAVGSAQITDGSIVDGDVSGTAAIALAKLADIATARILGRTTAGAGDIEELTATQAKALLAIAAGDVSGLGALATLSTVADAQVAAGAAIALTKLAALADQRLVGNVSGSSAAPAALTAAQAKTLLAIAIGDVTGLQAALDALTVTVTPARVTTGNVTMPDTSGSWELLSGIAELAVDAAEGDWVELSISAMRTQLGDASIDVAVVTGAGPTPQRYLSSGTSTPAIEGAPWWYFVSGFQLANGPIGFVVTAGDLDAGQVRFRLAVKATGTGTLYASADYPFYWQAKVYPQA